ncbi:unnamed protein product [Diamesa serratosioi]
MNNGSAAEISNYIQTNSPNVNYGRNVAQRSPGPPSYASSHQPPGQYQYQQHQQPIYTASIYENVDYGSPRLPVTDLDAIDYNKKFDSNNAKAQPQLKQTMGKPNYVADFENGRYAHTPQPEIESSPIYENLQLVSGQQAQPQASPANKSVYYYERSGSNSPQIPYQHNKELNASDSLVLNTSASTKYINLNSSAGNNYHMSSASLPTLQHPAIPQKASTRSLNQSKDYVQLNTPLNLPNPSQNASPSRSIGQFSHSSPTKSLSGLSAGRPHMEEINGSDYVCMSGGTLTKKLQQVKSIPNPIANMQIYEQAMPPQAYGQKPQMAQPFQPPINLINSYTTPANELPRAQYSTAAKIENDAIAAAKQSVNLNNLQNSPTVSPTPSNLSNGSGKIKGFKNLLPYSVTSRPAGKTEAERKIEELTRQLEEEMEKNEEQGEYFGVCHTCKDKVTGAGQACQAMGNLYHTNCFICCSCGRALRGKAFYNVHGRVYCEEDYMYSGFQQTSEKCNICGHLIMEMILHAMGKSYHPGCFRCCICCECLDGVPFTVDVDNKIYCVNDYHTIFAPKCSGCKKSITPMENTEETVRVVSMDKDFHVDCYVCEQCGMQLTDEPEKRCYPYEGRLMCRNCHLSKISHGNRLIEPVSVTYQYLG